MASEPLTATETELKLTPPDPVPPVAPERAMGLVPVGDEVKTKLEEKVDRNPYAGHRPCSRQR